jgi:hypothetical protein
MLFAALEYLLAIRSLGLGTIGSVETAVRTDVDRAGRLTRPDVVRLDQRLHARSPG